MTDLTYAEGFATENFLALAQRVWPRDYSPPDASAALAHTVNIGAWDGDRLAGSVRILTDGYFFATIPEILVDPQYQRRGIGRHLMDLALDRAPSGKMAFGAQPQSVGFFERISCRRALTGTYGDELPRSSRASAILASISVTEAETVLIRTKGPVITAMICHVPRCDPARLPNPTATKANGNTVSNRPPAAPQAANRGSDNSRNLRRRPAIPSTPEKNTPAKKPGIASAGSGASKTSKKASHGRAGRRMLATPISTPAIAQPNAHVRPIPIAPRMRLNHFITPSLAESDQTTESVTRTLHRKVL
jgi:GNAT superfamily N-acetyltransferase